MNFQRRIFGEEEEGEEEQEQEEQEQEEQEKEQEEQEQENKNKNKKTRTRKQEEQEEGEGDDDDDDVFVFCTFLTAIIMMMILGKIYWSYKSEMTLNNGTNYNTKLWIEKQTYEIIIIDYFSYDSNFNGQWRTMIKFAPYTWLWNISEVP